MNVMRDAIYRHMRGAYARMVSLPEPQNSALAAFAVRDTPQEKLGKDFLSYKPMGYRPGDTLGKFAMQLDLHSKAVRQAAEAPRDSDALHHHLQRFLKVSQSVQTLLPYNYRGQIRVKDMKALQKIARKQKKYVQRLVLKTSVNKAE